MEIVPIPCPTGSLAISLGAEEAVILLQPAEMFRALLGRNGSWRAGTLFLTHSGQGTGRGMLAILPRAAGSALLAVVAAHPVERELQGLLFASLMPAERPSLTAR